MRFIKRDAGEPIAAFVDVPNAISNGGLLHTSNYFLFGPELSIAVGGRMYRIVEVHPVPGLVVTDPPMPDGITQVRLVRHEFVREANLTDGKLGNYGDDTAADPPFDVGGGEDNMIDLALLWAKADGTTVAIQV